MARMTATPRTARDGMAVKCIEAGHYEISFAGHTFNVWRGLSEYGDWQWITDRDDKAAWSQTDTLWQAKATILAHGNDED
jgi:hypothetical protein